MFNLLFDFFILVIGNVVRDGFCISEKFVRMNLISCEISYLLLCVCVMCSDGADGDGDEDGDDNGGGKGTLSEGVGMVRYDDNECKVFLLLIFLRRLIQRKQGDGVGERDVTDQIEDQSQVFFKIVQLLIKKISRID